MKQQAKKKQSEEENQEPYSFSDEATKKKMKKHLTDIKDVITENDIANAKVPGKENDPVAPSEKEKEANSETIESLKNKKVTPWDALEE